MKQYFQVISEVEYTFIFDHHFVTLVKRRIQKNKQQILNAYEVFLSSVI